VRQEERLHHKELGNFQNSLQIPSIHFENVEVIALPFLRQCVVHLMPMWLYTQKVEGRKVREMFPLS
jgi:hypothetical protein